MNNLFRKNSLPAEQKPLCYNSEKKEEEEEAVSLNAIWFIQ